MIRARISHSLPPMGIGWQRAFLDHPRSVGESYGEHFSVAAGFGLRLIAAGFACLVHAWLPGCFTRTGSQAVRALAREMDERARIGGSYAVAASAETSSARASLHSLSRS